MSFRHVMINLGEQFSDHEVDEMLQEIDVSGNGIIRYEGEIIVSFSYRNIRFFRTRESCYWKVKISMSIFNIIDL